jgi:3-oxoacyl-[acyl-carrier protein] reductase
VGESRHCELVITAEHVDAFSALSGDVNPLHMDDAAARELGFPGRVAHGMLALSAISRLIGTELPGPGALWISQDVQFASPVFVGDHLRATVAVEQVSRATGLVSLRTEVRNTRTGTGVLSGVATVRWPERTTPTTATTARETKPGETKAREMGSEVGRVAIVTGSSRGLGRAVAEALAADGVQVVVHYAERDADANLVVEEIARRGGRAHACKADLRHAGGAEELFERACAAFGKVDIVVNSATPPILRKAVLDCTWADFEPYLEVYLRSTLRLTQLAAPGMQERRFGRVVNMLSSYALGAPPAKLSGYVTAKSALSGLSRALAVELGPFGITVNAVAPSMVITEQNTSVPERARQLVAAQTPMRRLATVSDVAEAVRFLCSDGAGFITGAVMPVTGGEVMVS